MTGSLCDTLRDRMPDVAAGKDRWTPSEEDHLDHCSECDLEWRLVTGTVALGTDVAAGVDPEAMAARVLEQLRVEARVIHFRRRAWWIGGVAAAAVLALIVGPMVRQAPEAGPPPDQVWLVPELDSLETNELILVLDGFEPARGEGTFGPEAPSFEDLESQELERVLQAWEG